MTTMTKEKTTSPTKTEPKSPLESKSEVAIAEVDDRFPKPTMPYVEVGMHVYWYQDGDRTLKPHAACVTDIGTSMLDVAIYGHGGGTIIRQGVRHLDDPKRQEFDNEEGAWEHTPSMKALLDVSSLDWQYIAGAWR